MIKTTFECTITQPHHPASLIRLTRRRGATPVGDIVHRVPSGWVQFRAEVFPGIYSYVNGLPPAGDQRFFRVHDDGRFEFLTRQQVFDAFAPSAA